MRVATWNLERATANEPRASRLRQTMRQVSADVWVLTETDSNLIPEGAATSISSETPERRHRKGERWVVLWSRRLDLEPMATTDPVRTVCGRLRPETGPPVLMYGTVLPWRADVRFHPARGGDAFCLALASQAADWQRLLHANPGHVLCVAGDFNQELDSPCRVGTRKGQHALTQALTGAGLICLSSGANDPLRRQTAGVRNTIDHICISSTIAALAGSSQCWPDHLAGLTDHYGTWVDLADT
jgi:Endonuclease/Exonuclease/phosphatase family